MAGLIDTEAADERYMRLALREAARGVGLTSPNPAVGAVIVRGGKVLSRGYHHAAGQAHAEVEAISALARPDLAHGATIYVTLEPCSTHGRTPPCTEAILAAGLRRVVVGAIDPNPRHAGAGLRRLAEFGVVVRTGVLAGECQRLNRFFNHWIVTRRPWVIAKAALTLDGKLTRPPSEEQWLSAPAARRHAQTLRARVDAILVGAGTVRADNPRLTVRDASGIPRERQPWRVVLTGSGILPADAHLFTDAWRERTLVRGHSSLAEVLLELGSREITSVLIEGGGQIIAEAFRGGLVNEVQFYFTPRIAGGGVAAIADRIGSFPPPAIISDYRVERIGQDVCISGVLAESDREVQMDGQSR